LSPKIVFVFFEMTRKNGTLFLRNLFSLIVYEILSFMTSLYQKYRPQLFSEIKGQTSIVRILSNAIILDRIGHAYLFTGPRGTGKTTLARLLAKAVNCSQRKGSDPCGTCPSCKEISRNASMNIIEIDAASYTGVDNIRQIRDEVSIPPTNAPYKVYIIDEVHMLSKGAFNALLKTLEEPPKHIIFILATTEAHKVPETVQSRTQRFDLSRISLSDIKEKLTSIVEKESFQVEEGVLDMVALSAEGGMRDAESLLTQLISLAKNNSLSQKDVQLFLGLADAQVVSDFAKSLFCEPSAILLRKIDEIFAKGNDPEAFIKRLLVFLRATLHYTFDPESILIPELAPHSETRAHADILIQKASSQEILRAIELLSLAHNDTKTSFLPQLPLEVASVKISAHNNKESVKEPPRSHTPPTQPSTEPPVLSPGEDIKEEDPSKETFSPKEEDPQNITTENPESLPKKTSLSKEPLQLSLVQNHWNEFLVQIKQKSISLSLFFSQATPLRIENDHTLILSTRFALHKDKINDQKTRLTAEEILTTLTKSRVSFICMTDEESGHVREKDASEKEEEKASQEPASDTFSHALEAFGGTVVET